VLGGALLVLCSAILVFCSAMTGVCYKNYVVHISCVLEVELIGVTESGICNYHWALEG